MAQAREFKHDQREGILVNAVSSNILLIIVNQSGWISDVIIRTKYCISEGS